MNKAIGRKIGKMTYLTPSAVAMGVNEILSPEAVTDLETEITRTILPVLKGRLVLPTKPIGKGKDVYAYDKIDHMSAAEIIGKGGTFPRDKMSRARDTAPIFKFGKGFEIYREDLLAMPTIQTENAADAARQVSEIENDFIWNGITHPATDGLFASVGNTVAAAQVWSSAIGTEEIYQDCLDIIQMLEEDGFNGPYSLIVDPINYAEIRRRDVQAGGTGEPIIDMLLANLISEVIWDATIPHGTALMMQKGISIAALLMSEDITIEIFEMDADQVMKGNVFERLGLVVRQPNGLGTITST